MDAILQKIRDYADAAHGEQKRKYTPERYIVHPVRVMELCANYNNSRLVLAAALLHDVLEDTAVTREEMYQFLCSLTDEREASATMALVVDLTDVYTKAAYPQWNRRRRKEEEIKRVVLTAADAQTIKYADIIDNCREIVQHDPNFARVFLRECRNMLQQLPAGHPELYALAKETVEKALQKITPARKHQP